jgi:hypothetical protein
VLEANASASQKREEAMEKLKHENALLQQQVQRLSLGVHAEDVRGEATSCRGQEVAESRVVSHAHDQTQPGKSGVGVMGLGGGETEAKAKAWSQAELLSEVSRLGFASSCLPACLPAFPYKALALCLLSSPHT